MASPRNIRWSDCPQPGLVRSQSGRETTLYNGVSNRSRGWKTKRFSDLMEGGLPEPSNLKRWDGVARTCTPWDNLRRDPELWYRDGNCYVHLYGKGQSRRGPAFKVPLTALLGAKCHPLLERFMSRDVAQSPNTHLGQEYFEFLSQTNPNAKFELYIPAPSNADKDEALQHHVATRNFFAWVFRKSMVGEHLGVALIGLMNSMEELRCPGGSNMDDMLSYLDEEGYLDMRNQPTHALSMLHFAEYFQFKEMYIDSFTHCVGMCDRLFAIPEYQMVTSISRKLIRRAKVEMDLRLGHAGVMLRNFLEDDLSEAHVGLTAGGRAHLERFRTFLLAFFTNRLGYYPPNSIDARSLIFEPDVYRMMRRDFEALYEYLVDESYTASESIPFLAQGGICTLQSVHGFDLRNKLPSLPHPLPLLPEIVPTTPTLRMSWLSRGDKLKPDQRLLTHSALMKAANKDKVEALRNPLVIAYRQFEEDSVFSRLKADRHEKLSQVDARKIRWILVYAVYQVVRSCTRSPPECKDTDGISYNIVISTAGLPPWREGRRPMPVPITSRRGSEARSQSVGRPMSLPVVPVPTAPSWPSSSGRSTPSGYEIKPDIDYFELTHRNETTESAETKPPTIPTRARSLNKSLRRTLSFIKSQHSQQGQREVASSTGRKDRTSTYHEIVVNGYGNGTNKVQVSASEEKKPAVLDPDVYTTTVALCDNDCLKPQPLAIRSPSTSSNSSSGSTAKSTTSSKAESGTSSVTTAPSTPCLDKVSNWQTKRSQRDRDDNETTPPSIPARRSAHSPSVTKAAVPVASATATKKEETQAPPELPRRSSKRKLILGSLHPSPLRIRKGGGGGGGSAKLGVSIPENADGQDDDNDNDIQSTQAISGDDGDMWSQYAHIGGLREIVSSAASGRRRRAETKS
ncbi:hypothetical protein QBC46DRAFT_128842 [Diplogelasinospora grovesii]|uniref:DUF8004 domain-containing protein n=1 Tax=Diplogelasinospora grovesii TaxID=303347 RepID=A0AAN6N8N6_9PEZI|nr:hypothetical protein QBC46DRAFT_128842 [Diplogelasinospora grovesii]